MNNELNPVVLCEEDFSKLKQLVALPGSAKQGEMSLAHEIARAIIVKNDSFPPNTIRIGSTVCIEDVETKKTHEFTIVMPSAVDIKRKFVSILSPMAAAIIGFRQGEEVIWEMPSGLKRILIKEVQTPLPA
ncbi:GreA/GreB family elongation factor [Lacibacter sediminis]|uniref:GreA/GreB family elongation factor n=1 Tax=Lacibacter sediminis TaxID=2760713 RepID=A0A7G5XC67_9BACT|nr:GreA/GreB family elongation factor [Lacibacter sediminis]QNA43070.1 GreA/GreB family elongation factor [Lacibacter sediminis]